MDHSHAKKKFHHIFLFFLFYFRCYEVTNFIIFHQYFSHSLPSSFFTLSNIVKEMLQIKRLTKLQLPEKNLEANEHLPVKHILTGHALANMQCHITKDHRSFRVTTIFLSRFTTNKSIIYNRTK